MPLKTQNTTFDINSDCCFHFCKASNASELRGIERVLLLFVELPPIFGIVNLV